MSLTFPFVEPNEQPRSQKYLNKITIIAIIMHYRTINLKPSTYDKLIQYKVLGNSFDEVINGILDEIDPIEMYEHKIQEHKKRLKTMESGDYVPLKDLKRKLGMK